MAGEAAKGATFRIDAVGGAGAAIRSRLRGPGGFYNLGNALALAAGLAVQVAGAAGAGDASVLAAVRQYLVGSPAASALTLAILVFFVSGEFYHRAWAHGFPPDRRGNWWGDFLSGVAALILTFALAAFGDLLLALASGLLLAAGKFGSALRPEDYATPDGDPWPDRFRWAVVASRAPAILALAVELARGPATDAPRGAAAMTAVMLVCYLLWTRADLLLFVRPRPGARGSFVGTGR
jgi:hypothetical protein